MGMELAVIRMHHLVAQIRSRKGSGGRWSTEMLRPVIEMGRMVENLLAIIIAYY